MSDLTWHRMLTAATVLVLLGAVAGGLRSVWVANDTALVVQSAELALAHLGRGQLTHWGGSYPLLQAIPAAALRAAGLDANDTFMGLVVLNVLSFAAMVWTSWYWLRRQSTTGALLVLAVLLSSTLLWYLHVSLGEPLAAALTLGAVVACWHDRRHLTAAALLFLAGLSKDTAPPFLLLLGLSASIGSPHWSDASFRLRRVIALVLAGVAAVAVTAGYNYARFGSLLDTPYLVTGYIIPWVQTQISFGAAVWLSPNGGALLFWPSFGVLLALSVAAGTAAFRSCVDWRDRARRLAPAAGAAGVLAGMTLELSHWWAPLGWTAWGSRLILPWLPAVAYLLVVAYAREMEALLERLIGPAIRFWPAAITLAAVSLPQYVAMVRPSLFLAMFVPDAVCQGQNVQINMAYYVHCTNHQFWTKGSLLLPAYLPGRSLLLGCACAGGLIWLLYLSRMALPGHRLRTAAAKAARPVTADVVG
jgi:hypothetical protein